MMAFVDKLTRDATAITPADVQGLRDRGFTDAEIFDIVAAAALGASSASSWTRSERKPTGPTTSWRTP